MTVWSVLSVLCKAVGFFTWADKLWQIHESSVKARSEADAPVTNEEEADDLLK